jgi:N-acetylglucosamine-6-phosphate deacetylase
MRIRGRLCETGEVVTVTLTGDRITAVAPDAGPVDLGGDDLWLAPAFLDLQVNGYGGHDFNLAPLGEGGDGDGATGRRGDGASRAEGLAQVARAIVDQAARAGTAMLCPTICTNRPEAMRSALAGLARACDEDRRLARALPAFHVEGPFIATEDGPRGAHPREWVRDPEWDEFQAMQEAAGGRIRILTLAPEREGSLPFIERVSASGVVISLGHTGATPEQIRDAVRAGARMSTHLGNGAHAQLARHPNYIWEQLAADAMWASIIADGHHLPPAVVKCMARVKGPDKLCLVSDAVTLGGQPPGIYNEGRHEVLPSGKVVLAGTPYLAGAGHLLDTCVANAVRFTGWPIGDVVRAATANPAAVLGIDAHVGRVAPGMDAHLTLFRLPEEGPLLVEATMLAGEVVWKSEEFRCGR